MEGTGFEPSVPLLRKALLGVANRRRRHERQGHLQVQARDGNACLEWLPIAFPFAGDREFESVFLQERVCETIGSGAGVVTDRLQIRRAYFAQNMPIKTICREFRVSRRVVRKVIRSQATEFRYERSRQPLPRIDPWREQLDGLLLENEGKPARERLTLIRIFEELRALGYEGSYDAVRRYAKRWRAERGAATAQAYVPLSFAPGEGYQFDWSHEVVLINGATVTVKVAHVRLCHSRMLFVRAYLCDAHNRAFAFFRGTCTRGIYDNMKTAVETRASF